VRSTSEHTLSGGKRLRVQFSAARGTFDLALAVASLAVRHRTAAIGGKHIRVQFSAARDAFDLTLAVASLRRSTSH
jgi:hypothetical protein